MFVHSPSVYQGPPMPAAVPGLRDAWLTLNTRHYPQEGCSLALEISNLRIPFDFQGRLGNQGRGG